MSDKFDPTPEEAYEMRDAKGIGIQEARRILRRRKMLEEINHIRRNQSPRWEMKFERLLTIVEAMIEDRQ